jgi:hypothetical protein
VVILDELSSSVISKSLEWNELHLKKMEKSFDVKSREAVMEGISSLIFNTQSKFVLILLMNLMALKGAVLSNKFPTRNKKSRHILNRTKQLLIPG